MMRALLVMSLVFFTMAVFATLIAFGATVDDATFYACTATLGACVACFGLGLGLREVRP
jgi:hypothetical protein